MNTTTTQPTHVRMMLCDTDAKASLISQYTAKELQNDYILRFISPMQNFAGEVYVCVVTEYNPVAAKAIPAKKAKVAPVQVRMMLADSPSRVAKVDVYLHAQLSDNYLLTSAVPIQNFAQEVYICAITEYNPQKAKSHQSRKDGVTPNHIKLMLAENEGNTVLINNYIREELELNYLLLDTLPMQNFVGELYVCVATEYNPRDARTHAAVKQAKVDPKETKQAKNKEQTQPELTSAPTTGPISSVPENPAAEVQQETPPSSVDDDNPKSNNRRGRQPTKK